MEIFTDIPFWTEPPPCRAYQNPSPEGKLHRGVHQALLCHPSETKTTKKLWKSILFSSLSFPKPKVLVKGLLEFGEEKKRIFSFALSYRTQKRILKKMEWHLSKRVHEAGTQ